MRRGARLAVCFGALSAVACARAAMPLPPLEDVERVRTSAGAQEGARLAPEAYAHAEQEREQARREHQAGDDVASTLDAEHALAAYDHALTIARLARATAEAAEAQKAVDDATAQERALQASRERLERDAQELEQRIRVVRERPLPAESTPANAEREAARAIAARSLSMQARLLCGAARLIAPEAAGLAEASADASALEERLAKNVRPTPIDDAARSRARCLDVLTRARRGVGDDAGASDALLSELSAAGGWDPSRDERGVVVTLRDVFQGAALASDGAAKLQALGHVAASHPGFAVQIVLHDGPSGAPSDGIDAKRGEAAEQALVGAGATAAHVRVELAGTRAPLVDPNDPRGRARNERLEIVFVGGVH